MPTKITIGDIGCIVEYSLIGDHLTMVRCGGCSDALAANDCDINEDMSEDDIIAEVLRAWGVDYDGDMDASGVTVSVEPA